MLKLAFFLTVLLSRERMPPVRNWGMEALFLAISLTNYSKSEKALSKMMQEILGSLYE